MKTFGGPARYHQGPGAIDRLAGLLAPHGAAAVVVVDAFVRDLLKDTLDIIAAARPAPAILVFEGEITHGAIDALAARLGTTVPTVVAGIGGGKALDAGKALARRFGAAVVTVPTIASNDSPTSCAIAMYDEHHVMVAVDQLATSPVAVLVDTRIIASAPAHFLRAGIGDALSKKFEAEACLAGMGVTPFGTRPTLTALAVADHCYRVLRRHAAGALAAASRHQADDAFEAAVEATILASGLGFENGGLSIAHSLTRGLVRARGARNAAHGLHVAWGLLVQLRLEGGRDELMADLARFYREIELPSSLGDLGMAAPSRDEIRMIADLTMTAPHLRNFARPVDAALIATAIMQVEADAERAA